MEAKKMNVMVVDDDESVRDFFGEFLKRKEADVAFADNGRSAVDEAHKNHYDLIFMDIVLPEIHGVQAYEKIKELGQKIPVVMMTGYAVEELIKRARKDGVKAVLKKPFTLKEVEMVYDEVVKSSEVMGS